MLQIPVYIFSCQLIFFLSLRPIQDGALFFKRSLYTFLFNHTSHMYYFQKELLPKMPGLLIIDKGISSVKFHGWAFPNVQPGPKTGRMITNKRSILKVTRKYKRKFVIQFLAPSKGFGLWQGHFSEYVWPFLAI